MSKGNARGMQDDVISRQQAIDALKEHRALYCDNTPDTFSKLSYAEKSRVDELDMAIATLVNLPPAEPNRGKWKITNLGAVGVFDSCSECKRVVKHKAPFYNFCPNCGADMRKEAKI